MSPCCDQGSDFFESLRPSHQWVLLTRNLFLSLSVVRRSRAGNTSPESHILIDHEAVDLTGGQDPHPWVDTHPFNGGKIMSKPLIVGVDVHRKTNTFCLMDASGQEVRSRFTLDNNRPGTQAFVQQVAELMEADGFSELQIAAEATGWYWFHFFQSLQQEDLLAAWLVDLHALNPRLTANFKKSYVDVDKTDPIDAFVIADRLRWGRDIGTPFEYDETYLALRFLTRYRYHVVHNLAREKAYCTAILYLKASEYTRQDKKPFSDLFGAASRAVIQEFASIEEIAAMPFEELVEFIDIKGKRRFPHRARTPVCSSRLP